MDRLLILTIAAILFIGYCSLVTVFYKWLPSISASFYELKKSRLAFLFTLFLFTLSMLIILAAKTRLMTIAGLFIIGVSIFPYFLKQKWQHYLCAFTGIIIAMISLIVDFKQPLIVLIYALIAAFLHDIKIKNIFWWVEILAVVTILSGLLIVSL